MENLSVKRDAIALAAYFPSRRSIVLFIEMLNYLEENFLDCDLYVGINPSEYAPIGITLLKQSNLKLRYLEVCSELDTKSDASGFQASLLLMKQSCLTYDIVYFMHLKGASLTEEYKTTDESGREVEFNVLKIFLDIFKNRDKIERIFKSNSKIGTYSHLLGKSSAGQSDVTSELMEFKFPPFFTYLHFYTFYAARGTAIRNILLNAYPSFFNSNLANVSDIYFFERDFTQMIWRQGLIPAYDSLTRLNDGLPIDSQVFSQDVCNFFENESR